MFCDVVKNTFITIAQDQVVNINFRIENHVFSMVDHNYQTHLKKIGSPKVVRANQLV
jgi:hypothetical protein